MKMEWKIDVPVLLIFFARPDTLEKVFESVREARPSTLLLWQDGPRENRPDDIENIKKCRDIVENIDWDCTVYKMYNEKNYGCDPSTFYSHKWAFSLVDKCIVLEDDFLVDQSFFPYCKELLDKYENDERINHICGFNLLGEAKNCPYDYLFSFNGSGAWASWKRVADGWDETYSFLQNEYLMKNLRKKYGKQFDTWYLKAQKRQKEGKAYWESILGFDCILNNRYAIIPKKNLVSNIGLTYGSTHSNTEKKLLTKKQQSIFDNPFYEINFPMKHPPYVVPDFQYMEDLNKLMGKGHPLIRAGRKVSYLFKCIRYGKLNLILASLKRKIIK